MKSKVHIKSHPLHPILVGFPIAFFIAAFTLDVVFLLTSNALYGKMAFFADGAGIATGVLAAIPGIIDYTFTVPPDSSAKKRAMKHGLLNGLMLLVYITAFILHLNETVTLLPILALEGTGVVLLGITGWLGGTLVYRNQVGVDHRYAAAGKWKEQKFKPEGKKIIIPHLDELGVDQMKLIIADGKRIVLARTESGYVAFDDHCTHRGGSLADGVLICGTVQCPWHGSQFDVHSGAVKAGPAKEKIRTYALEGGKENVTLELKP